MRPAGKEVVFYCDICKGPWVVYCLLDYYIWYTEETDSYKSDCPRCHRNDRRTYNEHSQSR
jgi:hypothetical protein